MPNRRRLIVMLSASLMLVLAQLLVLDHVHAAEEPPTLCAYCLASSNVIGAVAETQRSVPFGVAHTILVSASVARVFAVRRNYSSRAPPAISS